MRKKKKILETLREIIEWRKESFWNAGVKVAPILISLQHAVLKSYGPFPQFNGLHMGTSSFQMRINHEVTCEETPDL